MKLCTITDRRSLPLRDALAGLGDPAAPAGFDDEEQCWSRLVAFAHEWARCGVDYIQVRERDLDPFALDALVRRIVAASRAASGDVMASAEARPGTRVVVNGSASIASGIAVSAGADGVHLPGEWAAGSIDAMRRSFGSRRAVVSVACHSLDDVARARDEGADLVLFAPVFGKVLGGGAPQPGVGLAALAEACRVAGDMPVLALGGVTAKNAQDCVNAGAAGIAAIRLFMSADWRALRDVPLQRS